MKSCLLKLMGVAIIAAAFDLLAFGQSGTTAPLSGAIIDPNGAAISGASVIVKNEATGAEFKVTTSSSGVFTVPALSAGVYRVTVEAQGFKKSVVPSVQILAATPATVNVTLEVGAPSESVVVQGGGEVLQTQTANVATTINGRQISELPFVARDAMQLVLTQPGVTTPGTPRTSSMNGLPKGSINLTLNGLSIQDNLLKSSDGFFAVVQPKADAVEEVTISTATPGAESGGEGAVQVKFITKSGTNEFHGGAFWQHRNTALNSNYYFNNLNGLDRERVLLNQYGGRLGGPIIKDKLLFFFNYEGFRLPQSFSRVGLFGTPVTVLTPNALNGIFTYKDTNGVIQQRNLYTEAGNRGFTSTPDPLLLGMFTKINQLAASGGRVTDRITSNNDFNRNNLDFLAPAQNKREFFTGHLDYNITSNHHFDVVYDYQYYDSAPDNVNNQFQAYPGTGTVFGSDVLGSVHRNTFALGGALRSTLSSTIVNEAHFGLSGGGTTQFGREIVPSVFDALGGNALSFNNYLTNPQNRTTFSARNTPVYQFFDNLYWTRASHRLTFGMSYTRINSWQKSYGRQIIPQVTFNAVNNDPILTAVFNTTVFPNSTSTDRTNAAQLYSLLTGRVSQISRSLSLDENSKNYAGAPLIERNRQMEYGFYAQDSWQARPNLTLNYGLRWQIEPSPHSLNGIYSSNTIADIYGVSGVGNLFKPGTFSGSAPVYVPLDSDTPAYKTQYGQFAPSFGFAYKLNGEGWGKWLGGVVGKGDQTVIRGGYSIAYVREGLNTFLLIPGSNQGPTISATVDPANTPSIFPPGSVLYRNRANFPVRTDLPSSQQQSLIPNPGNAVNAFDPNLKPGYVQSWTFGIQRELTKDTVLEVRYVGNHGTKLWRQVELNQVNISNNGFLDEFKRAQQNQAICSANSQACLNAQAAAGIATASRSSLAYGNFGLLGQQSVPIIQTAIGGTNSGVDTTFITSVQRGEAARAAQNIALNTGRMNNLINAGLVPFVTQANGTKVSNYFLVNPTVGNGGAFLVTNGTSTNYNGLQVELRRRLSKGLLVQGSYAFSKSISNMYNSSNAVFSEPVDLRDPGRSRGISPWDITHAFKVNWLYEIPTGRNHWLGFKGDGFAAKFGNTVVGDWQFNGVARIQSGTPFLVIGGRETATANDLQSVSSDNGVVLHGLTRRQLQDLVKIRHIGNQVYFLPKELVDNSLAAFEAGGRNLTQLDPNAPYIGPVTTPGEFGERVVLYGPQFTRFDLSLLKRFRIKESKEFQFRVTMLNAFNNINFLATSPGNDSSTFSLASTNPIFGTTTFAYRDSTVSGTNDPGGRLVEFQLRFNF
jgi:hypothetical protein